MECEFCSRRKIKKYTAYSTSNALSVAQPFCFPVTPISFKTKKKIAQKNGLHQCLTAYKEQRAHQEEMKSCLFLQKKWRIHALKEKPQKNGAKRHFFVIRRIVAEI